MLYLLFPLLCCLNQTVWSMEQDIMLLKYTHTHKHTHTNTHTQTHIHKHTYTDTMHRKTNTPFPDRKYSRLHNTKRKGSL